MRESPILNEVEACLAHHRIFVVPRNYRGAEQEHLSIWALCDPTVYAGISWRMNTGAASFGQRRFVRFGVAGSPDFEGWLFGSGRYFGIEVKSPTGRLNPDQRARKALCGKTGAWIGVVRSYEECASFCDWIGLRRSG